MEKWDILLINGFLKCSEVFFLLFVMVKICIYIVRLFDILICCVRLRVREVMCILFDGVINID